MPTTYTAPLIDELRNARRSRDYFALMLRTRTRDRYLTDAAYSADLFKYWDSADAMSRHAQQIEAALRTLGVNPTAV